MRYKWKRIPTDDLIRRGEGPLYDDEMGVAEPRRRTTLMALLEEVDTAERMNEDRRIRATLQRQAAESNPNAIDEESGEDLVEVDEFVDLEDGGSSDDGSTQLENNRDYTFCYYCDDFVFKDSWNPARRTKEDEYERYCLLHTGTSGYGRSYSKVEQVFGHSTIALQLPDEDSEPESFSQSTHKNRKGKTAKTQSVRLKPVRMTAEQEFLWEYGSSEDEEDEDEDELRLVTKSGATSITPEKKRSGVVCKLEMPSEQTFPCDLKSPASSRKKRVVLSDEESEDSLQQAEIATSSKRARVRKQELETRSEHALPCDGKSPARLRKRKVVLSDEDSEASLHQSEKAISSKKSRQPSVQKQELETRSEQTLNCDYKSPGSSQKGKEVWSDEDSEDSLQQSESVASSKRPRPSPARKLELETRSEQTLTCERKSSASLRKRRVVLSDEDSEDSLQQSENAASSKRPRVPKPETRSSEHALPCDGKSPARSRSGRVVLSDEDSESIMLSKRPRQSLVGEHVLDKSSEETFHREHKSPAQLRKRKVVLSDEDSEGSLQPTSSKKSKQSPVQEDELVVEINC